MSSINIVDESEKRERFHTCTEDVTGSKCPKSASKKRPRIKTHAKTMIQVRRNYTKRKEPESENDLTEVFENPEEVEGEEDRSPKPKKEETIMVKNEIKLRVQFQRTLYPMMKQEINGQ